MVDDCLKIADEKIETFEAIAKISENIDVNMGNNAFYLKNYNRTMNIKLL